MIGVVLNAVLERDVDIREDHCIGTRILQYICHNCKIVGIVSMHKSYAWKLNLAYLWRIELR